MMRYSIVITQVGGVAALIHLLEAVNDQKGIVDSEYEIIVASFTKDEAIDDYMKAKMGRFETKYVSYDLHSNKHSMMELRNLGWHTASGEVVVFIDSNLLVDQDYFKEVTRYYPNNEVAVVIGVNLYQTEEYGSDEASSKQQLIDVVKQHRNASLEERHIALEALSYNINVHKYPWLLVNSSNLAVSKRLLQEFDGFQVTEEEGIEDVEFGYQAYAKKYPIMINHKMEAVVQLGDYIDVNERLTLRNIECFRKKYPNVLEESIRKQELNLFDPSYIIESKMVRRNRNNPLAMFSNNQVKSSRQERIVFASADELDKLKEYILASGEEKYEFIIIDEVENTNLDRWLQLQKFDGLQPKYYPKSKKIAFRVSAQDVVDSFQSQKNTVAGAENFNWMLNNKIVLGSNKILQSKMVKVKIKRLNLLMTTGCNLRCLMCDYVEMNKFVKEMSNERLKSLISEAHDMGLEQLELSGGEPMVRKDIYDIIDYTKRLGVENIIMMTNGTLIGENEAKRLVDSGLNACVISLEGDEALNDSIRGKGNFKKVMQAVQHLRKAKINHIRIGITISKINYKQLNALCKYLFEEVKIDSVSFNPFTSEMLVDNHFDERKEKFVMTEEMIEDLKDELKTLIQIAKEKNWDIPRVSYLEKIPDYFREKLIIPKGGCIEPQTGCCIDSGGGVHGCWGDGRYMGSIHCISLKEITSSLAYQRLCRKARRGACKGCLSACYEQVYE